MHRFQCWIVDIDVCIDCGGTFVYEPSWITIRGLTIYFKPFQCQDCISQVCSGQL